MKSKPAGLPAPPQWSLVNPSRNGMCTLSCFSVCLSVHLGTASPATNEFVQCIVFRASCASNTKGTHAIGMFPQCGGSLWV